jgi:hypothetical protein
MSWMITATGAEYHLHGPGAMTDAGRPVRIEDIAHQLAIINRFHGATKRPYSVAEHSLLCSEIAQRAGASLTVQMAALMHDAHEVYTNDLSSPAKSAVNYRSIAAGGTRAWDVFEGEHANVVRRKFGLITAFTGHRRLLREIDLMALATERRDLTAWRAETHAGWLVLGDEADDPAHHIPPIEWVRLDTPERERMGWQDWRLAFMDRFEEIGFGLGLQAGGGVAA